MYAPQNAGLLINRILLYHKETPCLAYSCAGYGNLDYRRGCLSVGKADNEKPFDSRTEAKKFASYPAQKTRCLFCAGYGNRTRVYCLGSNHPATERIPHKIIELGKQNVWETFCRPTTERIQCCIIVTHQKHNAKPRQMPGFSISITSPSLSLRMPRVVTSFGRQCSS